MNKLSKLSWNNFRIATGDCDCVSQYRKHDTKIERKCWSFYLVVVDDDDVPVYLTYDSRAVLTEIYIK